MRPITGADITDFYASGDDLLVLTADGEFAHIDGDGAAYDFVTAANGESVQILLERRTITDGEWFPDALDDDGNLIPAFAEEMAAIINNDGILPGRAMRAVAAGKAWEKSEQATNALAAARAAAVAEVAAYAGSQSAAARLLGLDQSTVNKLVKKANRATVGARATVPADSIPEDWASTGEVVEVNTETVVVELDGGHRQELPTDEVTPA